MLRSILIVDDSRVALASLSRLLRQHGLGVDTAESGPEALNYLRHNAPPGAIFLDHMMPGMDGFETLAALKAGRQTAAIPVIMYTSTEGDAYMAQAIAQGAVGVLHKPINPVELENILEQLTAPRAPATAGAEPLPIQQTSTPGRAGGVTGAVRAGPEPVSAHGPPNADFPARRRRAGRSLARIALILVLLAPTAWLYQRYQQVELSRDRLEQENIQLKAEQIAAQERATAEQVNQLRTVLDARQQRDRRETSALLKALAWSFNQQGQYAPDQQPLGDDRLARVRELVKRLTDAGFRGTLRIEVHAGQFCLVHDEHGESRLARDDLPVTQCELLVQAPEQAVLLSQRESPAFTRYLAEQGADSNPVQINVISQGTARPLVPYPGPGDVATAGEWNRVARLNQRVEIVLVPAP